MPKYKYKARDREGLPINGELEVENEEVLASKLDGMGYILISASEEKDFLSGDIFERFRKIKLKALVEFAVEVATLMEAGVPLLTTLEVMEDQMEDPLFKRIVGTVRKDITGGSSFSEALAKHPQAFSNLFVSMVRAGEATGELDKILTSLAKFLETENENKNKVKSAMMYPLVMLLVALAVVLFLVLKVLPSFEGIFQGAGVDLPLPTVILLNSSKIIKKYWLFFIIGIGASIYGIKQYIKTEKGRYYFDLFSFKVPVFGILSKKSIISRFSRTFGTLMDSAVPILQSLEIVTETLGNTAIAIVIDNIRNNVRQGGSIAEQIELSGIFPKMVSKMISVGESSGTLNTMLHKIADFYDSEVENELKGLTSVLEPIMIAVMGVVISLIVLSVMLPMFDMMSVAKK